MSAQRYRPVVIAMAIMWVMQPAVHKVVDMISMHVMQMTVVQIIDMVLMVHSRVPTVGTMLMCVIRMMPLGAGGHGFAHLSWVLSGRAAQCRLPFEELA